MTNPKFFAFCCHLLRNPLTFAFTLGVCLCPQRASAAGPVTGPPTALQCESLVEPLGLDSMHPRLSWHLQDGRNGARQTAYEIGVFSQRPLGVTSKADLWDSGRIASDVSAGVLYQGLELKPEKRYFWRVTVWDQDGKAYPTSAVTWFETGLLQQSNWQADWIGYEPAELHSLRKSGARWITNASPRTIPTTDTHHDFRYRFALDKPVATAVLYETGQDTTAAWVNGRQVLQAKPLAPWKQMPWSTYERLDVTRLVAQGNNLLAIAVTRFKDPGAAQGSTQAPVSAALSVAFTDGSTKLFTSSTEGWKAQVDAPDGWWEREYSDDKWPAAELYTFPADAFGVRTEVLPWPTGPAASLRKSFSVRPNLVSARLYATALGAYKFHLNGSPVGDQILSPGWMDFREHVPYQVYDVTRQVQSGRNALSAYLASGWYNTPLRWSRQGNNYGATQPALKAQLRLEYADRSVSWVVTDSTWKADISPILFSEIYDGETRDARHEQPGWDTAAFEDKAWQPATIVPAKEPRIVSQFFPPIRAERTLTAKTITEPSPGVYIVDFGQNMSALPQLHVRGQAGQDIKLRFAEVLNSDGTLYTDNLRTAKATDHFVLAGGGFENFQPLFTFHGFRYAEITGLQVRPTPETLKAVVLHTDAPFTSTFSTGNPMINQLWNNILWGQRSNFVGVPTDCPQRDERLGWSADAQVFWRTATFNMDLSTFSQKYAADLHGTQVNTAMYGIFAPGIDVPNPGYGAAWSDAGVIIPWTGWIQSGNERIVDENWDGMQRYLAEIESKNPDYLWRRGFGTPFGDWLTPTITTPEDLLATAYWAYDVTLMRQMALATRRTADAGRYAALFNKIKAAFQQAYIQSDGSVGTSNQYPSFEPPAADLVAAPRSKADRVETQTGYVLALYTHLVPEPLRAAAAEKLVAKIRDNRWLLGTGFLGTPYLLAVLSDTGHSDIAYRILLNHQYPSWGYLIDHGATTTWERWNGDRMRDDPSMNSYNHYAYGAVAEWLYRYAAGVDTDSADPGFHTISLHPNFDASLGGLRFTYNSTFGTIRSEWVVVGKDVRWKITVPPNTSAVLYTQDSNAAGFANEKLPLGDPKSSIKPGKARGEFLLPAGSYSFTATLQGVTSRAPATRSPRSE